jgi:hypothetical protein
MVTEPLAEAWDKRNEPAPKWIQETADAIEKLGNQNPSNSGFILLKEEPGDDGLSAVVLPQSIDWKAHEMVKNLPALQHFKAKDPKKFIEMKNLGDRTIRLALTGALHQQIALFAENVSKIPTYRLAHMSQEELDVIDALLAAAEEVTPPLISYMQLYVEDRLDFVLGENNEHLTKFHQLPLEKQKRARRNIVEIFGWQKLYPELAQG